MSTESGFTSSVVKTIQSARALFARVPVLLEMVCVCMEHRCDLLSCPIKVILSFVQYMLEQGHVFSTLKIYLAAISKCHVAWNGVTLGAHLALMLRALSGTLFEPLSDVNLKLLSLKTALLLPLASVSRVGDLTALLVNPVCMQFAPWDIRVVLRRNPFYAPKVLTALFRPQVVDLPALDSPACSARLGDVQHCVQRLCCIRVLNRWR